MKIFISKPEKKTFVSYYHFHVIMYECQKNVVLVYVNIHNKNDFTYMYTYSPDYIVYMYVRTYVRKLCMHE